MEEKKKNNIKTNEQRALFLEERFCAVVFFPCHLPLASSLQGWGEDQGTAS